MQRLVSRSSTLRLARIPGQTLVLAVLILALVLIGAELAARLVLDDSDRPTAIGSDVPALDVKIGALDRLDETRGVDCLFVGSSVVLNGLDPAAVEAAYAARTGEAITCYNVGVPALTARAAAVVAEVLVERYHPHVLVYGFTLRAVAAGTSQADDVYDDLLATPWIAYRRGDASLEGWLVDHSTLLRHYLAYRNWPSWQYPNWRRTFTDSSPTGYVPFFRTRPLDPAAIQTPSYFQHYALDPAEMAGLAEIVALDGNTRVVLLEMPLPDFVLALFDGGAAGYRAIVEGEIGALAEAHAVPLWQTSPLALVPLEGWAEDAHHVNHQGAQLVSAWLGERLADWAGQ